MIVTEKIEIESVAHLDIINITEETRRSVKKSRIHNGLAVLFCPGSTGALTTMEFEPGLQRDLADFLEELAPYAKDYRHHKTWGDDNGSGHLQSALIKTSFTVPIVNGEITLGTWQQIVFIECDTRGRNRNLVLQMMGE